MQFSLLDGVYFQELLMVQSGISESYSLKIVPQLGGLSYFLLVIFIQVSKLQIKVAFSGVGSLILTSS
jgi:hypothetical protein